MKDNLYLIKEKDTELSNGRTEESTKDNGKMVNNTELEYSHQKIIKLKKENG